MFTDLGHSNLQCIDRDKCMICPVKRNIFIIHFLTNTFKYVKIEEKINTLTELQVPGRVVTSEKKTITYSITALNFVR